jgi:hypothetical protein
MEQVFMSSEPSEKKIIIDEDWKSQVEAEKEAARHAEETKPADVPPPSSAERGPMPPADLSFLIGSIYIQGAMSLGLMANPATKKAEVQFDQAKYAIDMLAMLDEKTAGNRTPQESEELDALLHELRMAFVQVQSGAKAD